MLYLAFTFSGAAALIYETTWTRLLTLFMGHTVAAASTVLAAFMGGLAIGAALAGRSATRLDRPNALRAYAVLEILIAACAIALPFELDILKPIVAAAYDNGQGGAAFGLVRLACALAVVTLPAIAMGATLPLAVRWHVGDASRAGRDTGLLYAANTVGAALGAVLSGFVLLPALGIRMTTMVGVALNVVSAAVGWWLASRGDAPMMASHGDASKDASLRRPMSLRRRMSLRPPMSEKIAKRHPRRDAASHVDDARGALSASRRASASPPEATVLAPRLAAFALALSGCVSLILQIAWTRILALVVGPTTFAFSAMVATFIAGIAIGSVIGGSISKRRRSPWWLAGSLLTSGVAAVAAASWAPRVPLLVADAVAAPDASFATVVRLQSALIAALMMPMTVAFGAAFPLAVALAARDNETVSRDVAVVYTANTIGAIVGALAGGFLLVPLVGLQDTIRIAAAITVVGFAIVSVAYAGRRLASAVALAVAAVAAIVIVVLPPWDEELLSSGAYKYAPYLQSDHRDWLLRAGTLLYYREGAAGTVSVRRLTGALSLAIDGKVDASNSGDMLTQRLLAHVPLLLHPDPKRVGIIGLGSGVTLGSALRHPIARADMLEISPEVVEASRFFDEENHSALADPRTRLIVGDGRSHMALGSDQYDVIISEPSNPWMAGVAALFTREFFEAARRRLAPGGLLCQWAHTYDISDDDLRSIVATFTTVFPHAALWLVGEGDVLLIGSAEAIEPRLAGIRAAWVRPGVSADLAEVEVRDPDSLLTLFAATGPRLKSYADGALVQTDDGMTLEFSAPRGIYGRSTADNAATLRGLAHTDSLPTVVREALAAPQSLTRRGLIQLRAEANRGAFEDFLHAIERDPLDDAAIDGMLRTSAAANGVAEAEALLRRTLSADPRNVSAAVALSRLIAGRGEYEAAAEPLRPLFSGGPPPVRALDQMASLFADAGDATRLAAVVTDLHRVAPDSESTLYYSASLQFMAGRAEEAIRTAELLRARNPRHARCLNLLGAAYATVGRRDDARRAFEASIAAEPRDPTAYANLGTFELEAGNARAAADYFAETLTLDPSSAAAQEGLSRTLASLGR